MRDDGGEGALVAGDQYECVATVWFLVQHVACLHLLSLQHCSRKREGWRPQSTKWKITNTHPY